VGGAKPLVEASAGAVDHHEGRPAFDNGVFDGPCARFDDQAAPGEAGIRRRHRGAVGARGPAPRRQHDAAEAGQDGAPGDHFAASRPRGGGDGATAVTAPARVNIVPRFYHTTTAATATRIQVSQGCASGQIVPAAALTGRDPVEFSALQRMAVERALNSDRWF
jgi:hypothetical protein